MNLVDQHYHIMSKAGLKKLSEYSLEEITKQEPQIISELLDRWQHIKKTGEALEARAKVLLQEETEIPNWELKDGAKKKSISNVKLAVDAVLENGELNVKPADLLGICSIPLTKLTEVIVANSGESKKKATEMVTETLGELIVISQNKPSLKRAKKE